MSRIQTVAEGADLLSVVLWQFNHDSDDSIEGLLKSKGAWYQQYSAQFWQDWYDDVFNIQTANEFGLAVWALVLGVSFDVPGCTSYVLSVEQKRLIIRLRFYQLTTRCTVDGINAQLDDLFGNAYVLDPLNMSPLTYVFEEQPNADVALVLSKYDLLPRPSAVGVSYRVESNLDVFGFGEFNQNFENGGFYAGNALITYDWDLTLSYDSSTGYVSGVLGSAAGGNLNNYMVDLLYTNTITGETVRHELYTRADGAFTDTSTPEEGAWTVVAKAQIKTPICTIVDVESPQLAFSKIVYKFELTGAFDSDSKQVAGQLTCNQNVSLAGQNVVITYTPDAANGEGTDVISHTVDTAEDGSYSDPNTPASGRYTCHIECDVVLEAEDVHENLTVDNFTFTNISYEYGLSIAYDPVAYTVSGKLTCNQPLPSVENVSVEVFYYDRTGNHNVQHYVRTDSEGNYVDKNPPAGYDYAVFATVKMQGPFQTDPETVVSPTIRFEITYTYGLVLEYDGSAEQVKGTITRSGGSANDVARQLVTITYTPVTFVDVTHNVESVYGGTFTDTNTPNSGAYTVVATCAFKMKNGKTVDLISNTIGYSKVPAGAVVVQTIPNVNMGICYIESSEEGKISVDFGDGNGPRTDLRYQNAAGASGIKRVLPPANLGNLPLRETTVTYANTDTIRFVNATGTALVSVAPLHEIISVSSNKRTSLYILAPYTYVEKIHEGAFDNLPNVTSCDTVFARCTRLTDIPAGLLDKMTGLTSTFGMFANINSLVSFPAGLLDACAGTILSTNSMFNNCTKLTSDPATILQENSPTLANAGSMFAGCTALVGSGQPLINNMERVAATPKLGESMFKGCTKLSDYGSLDSQYTK